MTTDYENLLRNMTQLTTSYRPGVGLGVKISVTKPDFCGIKVVFIRGMQISSV